MARILLVPHRGSREASELARSTIDWLMPEGHQVVVLDEDARATGLTPWAVDDLNPEACDLAVSMGGDGTMLRALDLMGSSGVPVLGVNFGHLGYLTEVEPEGLRDSLNQFFSGNYELEERMTMDVVVTSAPEGTSTQSTISLARSRAINEVVVEKSPFGTTVRVEVSIDDKTFLTYAVDGMIVATPTGSTAYNLSARGPILSPSLDALLLTPVSAHMLFDRSMVLDGSETVSLRVLGRRDAAVVIDGRHVATMTAGGKVECKASETGARLVTFSQRDFRQVLKTKFGLADR